MPRGCQNAIKAYTDTDLHAPSRKSFSFLPVEPAEIAGLLSLPPSIKWHYHYINLSLTALQRSLRQTMVTISNWLFAQTDPDSSG